MQGRAVKRDTIGDRSRMRRAEHVGSKPQARALVSSEFMMTAVPQCQRAGRERARAK